jgi:flagellar motor switch protein FliM
MSDSQLTDQRTARPFDFRHPSTLSRDDARALQVLQETFAHGVATTLASAVRASIDVAIGDIDQTPYGEVVRRTPNPCALILVRLDPITPVALLQIDPDLSFAIVELLLGGPGSGPHPARAHTELEEILLTGLIDRVRPSLDEAFAPIAATSSSLIGQESNPTFVQIAPATDMVVTVSLDVGVDAVRGGMRLVVPVSALRPHLDALVADPTDAPSQPEERAANQHRVADVLGGVDVAAVARFDPVVASSRDLADLAVGDIFTLGHSLDTPLILEIGGVAVHDVGIGRIKRHFAAEVLGPAPDRSRRPNRLARVAAAIGDTPG